MSRVTLTFHAAVRRWDIADEVWAGRCDMQQLVDGLWVGRGADTIVREIAIELAPGDRAAPPTAVAVVREAFGDRVADLVAASSASSDVELSVDAAAPPARRSSVAALPDEPGVPVAAGPARYDVPLPGGTGHVVVRAGGLDIVVPRPAPDDGDRWVRISDGDSGVMLAVSPVADAQPRSTADVPFGLDIAVDALHVWVTPDPTRAVGPRDERRRAWATALVEGAESRERRRPRDAGDAAQRAARVAETIGDAPLVDRARCVAERSMRRRRRRLAVIIVAALAFTALLVALPRLLDGADTPRDGTFYENCDDARRAGATPLLRTDPGYRSELDRDGDGRACE